MLRDFLKYCKIKIKALHFYLLGGIFAIKVLTATKEFFLDVLFIFEFLTRGISCAIIFL